MFTRWTYKNSYRDSINSLVEDVRLLQHDLVREKSVVRSFEFRAQSG